LVSRRCPCASGHFEECCPFSEFKFGVNDLRYLDAIRDWIRKKIAKK